MTQSFNGCINNVRVQSASSYKGYFETIEKLKTSIGYNGDYADVSETNTRWRYEVNTWVDTYEKIYFPPIAEGLTNADVAVDAVPDKIVRRTSNGSIIISTPQVANEAATKAYVDKGITELTDAIENPILNITKI